MWTNLSVRWRVSTRVQSVYELPTNGSDERLCKIITSMTQSCMVVRSWNALFPWPRDKFFAIYDFSKAEAITETPSTSASDRCHKRSRGADCDHQFTCIQTSLYSPIFACARTIALRYHFNYRYTRRPLQLFLQPFPHFVPNRDKSVIQNISRFRQLKVPNVKHFPPQIFFMNETFQTNEKIKILIDWLFKQIFYWIFSFFGWTKICL